MKCSELFFSRGFFFWWPFLFEEREKSYKCHVFNLLAIAPGIREKFSDLQYFSIEIAGDGGEIFY